MATKPLEIHPAALAELKSAVNWYLNRSRSAATKFAAEVDRAMDLASASPLRWPSGDYGTRKFALRRFPFAVIYREKPGRFRFLQSLTGIGSPDIGKTESDLRCEGLRFAPRC
jgi:plasmid stabilization system protein ParE